MEEQKGHQSDEGSAEYDGYGSEDEGEQPYTKERAREDMRRIQETEDMYELIKISRAPDVNVRQKAVQQMCPCRVKEDIPEFWQRLFELATDEDPKIRYQVLHNLCDGSPPHYENQIIECVELFNRDPDSEIRRRASKVMGSYLRTGKWNVL